jgi:hypothetical protein
MSIRRFSDHRSEPLEQQPKNGLALALGPAQPPRLIMEDRAGGAAFQTASGPMVEFMGGDFVRLHNKFRLKQDD